LVSLKEKANFIQHFFKQGPLGCPYDIRNLKKIILFKGLHKNDAFYKSMS